MSNITNILLRNKLIQIDSDNNKDTASYTEVATVIMNLSHYGYSLSKDAYEAIHSLSSNALITWWKNIETELKIVTGDNLKIDDFVVYKNFPQEVLDKSAAEYWIPQILMYWGVSSEFFTEEVKERPALDPKECKYKTLMLANHNTLQSILDSMLAENAAWKDWQLADVIELTKSECLDFSKIVFKENLVNVATHFINNGIQIKVKTATDVLRLAAGLSDSDVSLRSKVQFKSFKRKVRRYLMDMLSTCSNIEDDIARRADLWKKFFHNIHPGEFKKSHSHIVILADDLYNDRLHSFNSKIELGLKYSDKNVLDLLATRPGEYVRRLLHTIDVFGEYSVNIFSSIIHKLSVNQIVKLRSFLEVSHIRTTRAFPPKGNWAKLQISSPKEVDNYLVSKVIDLLGIELAKRVPSVSVLDEDTKLVKLPSGNDTGEYTRGTSFKIPSSIKFVRSASYWRMKTNCSNWFDNGWNFFDSKWNSVGAISWNEPKFSKGKDIGAAFSGDPVNAKDSEGRACQVIDLYLDKLKAIGVRYAVWNILCYSNIPFSQAEEVFAALQWGENANSGKIFEPSRSQLAFRLTGEYHTKYVCVIDLHTGLMTYIDANLKANVSSASINGETLSKQMPAYMDYISSLPSVHDLFRESVSPLDKGPVVLYHSEHVELEKNQQAYIFRHNGKQDYQPIDLNKILGP